MKEFWKDVIGYEGYYQVSNLGNIYSFIVNRNLTPNKQIRGYRTVTLTDKLGNKKIIKVHRLVCEAFLPNTDSLKNIVNHIDGNTSNNILENLEWVTPSQNSFHAVYLGRVKNQKLVLNTQTGIYYNCVRDAAISANVNYVTLLCRLNGNLKNKTSFIAV